MLWIRYETEFFMNVVHGKGIISWAAVDSNRSDLQCDELIGFVTARVVTATEGEVGYFTQFRLHLSALQFGVLLISFYIAEKGQQQLFLCCWKFWENVFNLDLCVFSLEELFAQYLCQIYQIWKNLQYVQAEYIFVLWLFCQSVLSGSISNICDKSCSG